MPDNTKPSYQEMVLDKSKRHATRMKAREKAIASGISDLIEAAKLAQRGHGVRDITAMTGCPEGFAKEMVLGVQ